MDYIFSIFLSFRNSKQNYISLKFSEFQELFMKGTFFLKLTQFKKTGSMGKLSVPLRHLNQNPLSKLEIYHVFSRRFRNWRAHFAQL